MSEAQTEPCSACGSILDVTGAQIFAERTCPVCGTQINVRRTFGHYELMSAVGHGGQGIVYRAVDNTLNRLVALKLLRTEYSGDPEFVKQFESEARVTASINHPNVVRVFSFGSGEGHVFLAMELVDRGTFDDLMEKLGRVPEARALQIGIEIARGLKAGYEKGLIHRDVKPGNILFSEDGAAKVVDFGLAMFFEQSASQTGEIWGTPYYLSPERLNRVQEDFRSDMYSLGATLFHAIAGRPPFEAEDASHVALKHLRSQAVSIQAFAPDVSNATAYVLNRTLLKNPADRQQSYDEFIEQLQFAREEALARASGGGVQKSRLVLDDVGAQRAMSWVTIVTLVILLAGIGVGIMIVTKVMKGDKGGDAPAVEAGLGTIERFGPGWQEAKVDLLQRNYAAAATSFGTLAAKHQTGTTERSWAIVHEALAILLGGDSSGASLKLGELAGGGTQVSKFFSEQVGPKLSGSSPITAASVRDFSRSNHEALAPLFFALKDYELGAADDTRALIGQFTAMQPEPTLAWLTAYRPLAKSLQEELDAFSLATNAWTNAKNPRAREEALAQLRLAPQKLPANSKLAGKLREVITAAEKQVTEERAARGKVNVAYGAKASASTWMQQQGNKPENAVDGDTKTRWRTADNDKNRWLMLDLGAPKPISRWVLYTASAGGEEIRNNIADCKLQSSSDGKAWTDVDTVIANRAGIMDRIVPEFTTRYVRVLGTASVNPKDEATRIFELELTKAGEQANNEFKAAESVATRFSTASDFIAGPIGEPAAKGSVTYEPQKKTYTVKGSGADVWTNNDAFQFVWQPVKGDCELVACVRSFSTKHDWSKALVMVRGDLTKDAGHGGTAMGSGSKLQFLSRKTPGQQTGSNILQNTPLPRWIKVVRKGSELTGYHSSDGKTWQEAGKDTVDGIGEVAFVGFGVCSHVDGEIAAAEFSDVSLTLLKP